LPRAAPGANPQAQFRRPPLPPVFIPFPTKGLVIYSFSRYPWYLFQATRFFSQDVPPCTVVQVDPSAVTELFRVSSFVCNRTGFGSPLLCFYPYATVPPPFDDALGTECECGNRFPPPPALPLSAQKKSFPLSLRFDCKVLAITRSSSDVT